MALESLCEAVSKGETPRQALESPSDAVSKVHVPLCRNAPDDELGQPRTVCA